MDNSQDKKDFKEAIKKIGQDFKMAIKDKRRWLYCGIELLIVAVIIVADLLTKKYVYGYCDKYKDIILIKNILRFTAVENTGASFGMFKDKTAALTVISAICSIFLIIFIFFSYPHKNKILRASLVMITGGAIGNIIDRIILGYVRDFIYFELINFAVFNIADSFLTIGTILLIIYVIFFYSKEEEELRIKKQNIDKPDKNVKESDKTIID